VAASWRAGFNMDQLREAYPFLMPALVLDAETYLQIHPQDWPPQERDRTAGEASAGEQPTRCPPRSSMSFKRLIDECLSHTLVAMAHAAGHLERTCVPDRGWLGMGVDCGLPGPQGGAAAGGLHDDQPSHAGLMQEPFFGIALQRTTRWLTSSTRLSRSSAW